MNNGFDAAIHRHDVIALAIGDWHLSDRRPSARAEADWLKVLRGYLLQLRDLQRIYSAPIIAPGDIFDRWDASPHTINNALAYMPDQVFAVPGNHDLPNHNYAEADRSAYWTLVEAKRIVNLTPGPAGRLMPDSCGTQMRLHAFPCGFEVKPCQKEEWLGLDIAVIHDYIWTKSTGFEHAPDTKRYGKWMERLEGYDIAIFGDNHKGFLIQSDTQCSVLNCGALIRRHADQIDYKPMVGMIHSNGSITRWPLKIDGDEFLKGAKEIEQIESALKINLSAFVDELSKARKKGINWEKTVILYCEKNKLDKSVKDIILRSVKEVK